MQTGHEKSMDDGAYAENIGQEVAEEVKDSDIEEYPQQTRSGEDLERKQPTEIADPPYRIYSCFRLNILGWTEENLSLFLLNYLTLTGVDCTIPFKRDRIDPKTMDIFELFSIIENSYGQHIPFPLPPPKEDGTGVMVFSSKPLVKEVSLILRESFPQINVYTILFFPESPTSREKRQGLVSENMEENSIVVFPKNVILAKKRIDESPEIMSSIGEPFLRSCISVTDIQNIRKRLDEKYPWLMSLTEAVLVPMEVASVLNRSKDKIPVKFGPILVVGPPGIGKSAWASDFGRISKIPQLFLSLGGKNTSTGFRSVEYEYKDSTPSQILLTIARNKCANPLIVLDEIDKVGDGKHNGNVQDVALHYFDPTTNDKVYDDYLKANVNLSGVLWICTANDIDCISTPLLDRLTIVTVDYPLPEHGPMILETIFREFEKSVGVDGEQSSLADYLEDCSKKVKDVVDSGIRVKKSLRQIRNEVFRILHEMILGRSLSVATSDRKKIGFKVDNPFLDLSL